VHDAKLIQSHPSSKERTDGDRDRAGPADDHFRVIDIWDSDESRHSRHNDRAGPATQRYLAEDGAPLDDIQASMLTLHALYHQGGIHRDSGDNARIEHAQVSPQTECDDI
jgi:hypothetical protein